VIKQSLKAVLYATALRPPHVRHCSQTIYQTLLGCLRLWESTTDTRWRDRADRVLAILLEIQRPDGGFDIGYDFNFGKPHRKGESTSPELVGLVALSQYARFVSPEPVAKSARRGVAWVQAHSRALDEREWAIPYGPYSTDEIMVYNGVSFAAGGLGIFLGAWGPDPEIENIYHGMIDYLNSHLSRDASLPGRFWFYSDQSRTDLDAERRAKIDYYHQMQQVEMHSLAEQCAPYEAQLVLIRDAADHVVALHESQPVIPYVRPESFFRDTVHVWGYCSCASGLYEAARVIDDRRDRYRAVAAEIIAWLLEHAWSGEHFYPILSHTGTPLETAYQVRSDAWVFNAIAGAHLHAGGDELLEVAERCYAKMARCDFSGPESHASNRRIRAVHAALKGLRGAFD
jgi:hypothetical protein